MTGTNFPAQYQAILFATPSPYLWVCFLPNLRGISYVVVTPRYKVLSNLNAYIIINKIRQREDVCFINKLKGATATKGEQMQSNNPRVFKGGILKLKPLKYKTQSISKYTLRGIQLVEFENDCYLRIITAIDYKKRTAQCILTTLKKIEMQL